MSQRLFYIFAGATYRKEQYKRVRQITNLKSISELSYFSETNLPPDKYIFVTARVEFHPIFHRTTFFPLRAICETENWKHTVCDNLI